METVIKKLHIEKSPAYTDSGIASIGAIPEHWQIQRLKHVCKINQHSLPEHTNKHFSFHYVDIGSVTLEKGIILTEEFAFNNAPSRARRIVREGDTIISTVRTYLKAIDYIDSHKSSYIYSTGFAVLTPEEIHPRFLTLAIKSDSFTNQVDVFSKGMSYPAINSTDLGRLSIAIPPKPEQIRIAQFLDRKTAQIDKAIAQKEKLIELLKERRQILVHSAVTRGLNPNVKMKDSGVEWIGEIPEHWEVRQLRRLFTFLNTRRVPISAEDRQKMGGDYPYYGASGIIDYVNDYIFDEPLILIAEDGANLLSKSTPLAFVATGKYWVNNHAHIIKPLFKGFTYWAELLSAIDYTFSISGAAQPKLTMDRLASIKLPLPSDEELTQISIRLEDLSSKINKAISCNENEIEKLKEYKATLINSAVTGKIKVS